MRKLFILLLFLSILSQLRAQELPAAYRAYTEKYPEGPALNHQDSIYLMNIPEKSLPSYLRSTTLPPLVDNSTRPYLRPVFAQAGASCGQAALVGYNFTYEMAYHRDQPAQFPQTQYPTHFCWNYQNGGNGWFGVSYFHSAEMLRLCGTMNLDDYGEYDDGSRWINGYDVYFNGMFNRVKSIYSINTSTAEGLETLKHWIYNHMGEGTVGGVASFYANVPWNANFLEEGTPEAGKYVMTAWFPAASHAMTIVGYNDSIRWDYNSDGQYTNNIDINSDGVVDPRDWEFGAVKFVNSHGIEAQDSGFCYMMYKCLAETFLSGGVWNQAVHILEIDEDYQPLFTYKVTLKHNYRGKVKIYAGVSSDTTDVAPEWLVDYPILDYQGANYPLQGPGSDEDLQYLEFGLDITPLLSYLEPGEPAKFFFVVDENDPKDDGQGEITAFSLMDYTSGGQEYICSQAPLDLENNSRTMVSLSCVPDFEIVEITTDELPPFSAGEPYSFQAQAAGGSLPYEWDAVYNYRILQSSETFPVFQENQVLFSETNDTIMPVPLGFDFPYFGLNYDTVFMHINGHLQFDQAQLPWPYMTEPVLHFRSNRLIAPMTNISFTIAAADGDGGWVELTDTTATFRWKLSWTSSPATTEMNFAARLYNDGTIEFIYGDATLESIDWLGGISSGNKKDYLESPLSGAESVEPGKTISFHYRSLPHQLALSENGLLTGIFDSDNYIYDLDFRVTDRSGLSDMKTLQLSSGPYLDFIVNAGGDERIYYGDTVTLDLEIRNKGSETLENTMLFLASDDPYVNITNASIAAGNISPNQTMLFPGAFSFIVAETVPDKYDLYFNVDMETSDHNWKYDLLFRANAPIINLKKYIIDDNDGRLDPGDTAPFNISYQNMGHAPIDGVNAGLISLNPGVQVLGNPVQDYGTIGKGITVTRSFELSADEAIPNGTIVRLVLSMNSSPGLQRQDTISLKIGKTPVLVIDMDPNQHSGPLIMSMLEELGVPFAYEYSLPSGLSDNQSVFICLGYHTSNHVITLYEGQKLAEYLEAGGRLYIEGRKTWGEDPGTPIQPYFNILTVPVTTIYDTITGTEGTFTQGYTLKNEAYMYFSFYYLEPVAPAFSIHQDNDLLLSSAVAYDAGSYKTIGSLFELGTLKGLPPHSTTDLLAEYLEFFGIVMDPVGLVGEKTNETVFRVYPNPAVDLLAVDSWRSAVGGQRSAVGIEVVDIYGNRVAQYQNINALPFVIDVSGLAPGMYMISINDDHGQSYYSKFLKISH